MFFLEGPRWEISVSSGVVDHSRLREVIWKRKRSYSVFTLIFHKLENYNLQGTFTFVVSTCVYVCVYVFKNYISTPWVITLTPLCRNSRRVRKPCFLFWSRYYILQSYFPIVTTETVVSSCPFTFRQGFIWRVFMKRTSENLYKMLNPK